MANVMQTTMLWSGGKKRMKSRDMSNCSRAELLQTIEQLNEQLGQCHSMIDGAPVILWMTDANCKSHYFNRQWIKFTGMKQHSQLDGKTWFNSLHSDDRDQCIKEVQAALEQRRSLEMVYRLRRYDGEYRWMLDSGSPHYADDGEFLGYVGASIDITERREAEEGLKKSHAELAQNNRNIALLSKMNDQLQVCVDMDEIYSVLSLYVPKIFAGSAGSICLINDSRSMVEAAISWGQTVAFEPLFQQEDCWALRQGKPHTVHGPDDGLLCRHLSQMPPAGYICAPMTAHGEVLGLLHLQYTPQQEVNNDHQAFCEMQQRLANTLAENLALALSSFRLREALRAQSVRDPLTQLFNRRYMMESFEQSLCRARRSQSEIGVLVLDVDYFKRLNDTYGHQAGDAVLQELSSYLRSCVRAEDIVCRHGGEEFMFVVPDAPAEIVRQRAESICTGVRELSVNFNGQQLPAVTLSIGVAVYPHDGETVDTLLKVADQRLYEAKAAGRDQVCMADQPPSSAMS